MVITWLPLLTQKWKDTGRDQTRNILHSEPIKYFLLVKFANLQWMPLNWILLEYKISKFNLFHLNVKFITNTKHKKLFSRLAGFLVAPCKISWHNDDMGLTKIWEWFSTCVCKRFLLEQVPVFIIIFLDSEEEY